MERPNCEYEVLNPWSEVDPKPLYGLSPRLTDLAGKTIGLFCHWKVSAPPMLAVVEERLKQRYPTLETSWFYEGFGKENEEKTSIDYLGDKNDTKDPVTQKYMDWVKGNDAVIAAVGD